MNNFDLDTLIILEDGISIRGSSIGISGQKVSELVFNTSMTGYQEILTDPSYATQSVVFTYPHIGNTGVNKQDHQSNAMYLDAIIIRDYVESPSSHRMNGNLKECLIKNKILGISNVDTRMLTRHIRNSGSILGCISSTPITKEQGIRMIQEYKKNKTNPMKLVSTKKTQEYNPIPLSYYDFYPENHSKKKVRKIVVLNFGVKNSILHYLSVRFSKIVVTPYSICANKILELNPDGIVLSNGPGDPRTMKSVILEIKKIIKCKIPLLGICLGHQLAALACGGKIEKMKFGHHGSNHPVYNIPQKAVYITSQNHSYCVTDIPSSLRIISYSLFDQTIQGLKHDSLPLITFQGHPEGSPGPLDCNYYFDLFAEMIEGNDHA